MVYVVPKEKRIQKYEIMVILNEDAPESKEGVFAKKFGGVIKSLGGKIVKEEFWGLRKFSYEIKKQKRGAYTIINFELEREKIKELKEKLKFMEEIVRYLLVKSDKPKKVTRST